MRRLRMKIDQAAMPRTAQAVAVIERGPSLAV